MRKLVLGIAGAAALAFGSAANASQTITISGPSGNYGDDEVLCDNAVTSDPCEFEHTYNFLSPAGYELVSSTITSVQGSPTDLITNIDLDWVTLNGVTFNLLLQGGQVEFGTLLNQALNEGGWNSIVVHGTTGGNGAYTGTLSFAPGVPEPATWAMMLMGFGAVGFSMRRRRQPALAQLA